MARDGAKTGRGRGGKRPGAGRPPGSSNALEYGEVKALRVAGLRVPKDASDEARKLADYAQARIIDVMAGEVDSFAAGNVLKAATHLRSEICGPVAQKTEISGANGAPLEVVVKLERDE